MATQFKQLGYQFDDDSGDPLINGLIYVYESGTTTLKDTFKDSALSIPNTNPIVLSGAGRLQYQVWFDGSARMVLATSADVQVDEVDPVGGDAGGGFGADWNSGSIYGDGDIVRGSDGAWYESLTDGNQGNDPISSPANWSEVELFNVWNVNQTYSEGDGVIHNGRVYVSASDNNLGNNPASGAPWNTGTDVDGAINSTGAGTKNFTATGAVAAQEVVSLNDDGTVSTVGVQPEGANTPAPIPQDAGSTMSFSECVYDPVNDVVVIIYYQAIVTAGLYAVVCSLSGATPSFGVPVLISASTGSIINYGLSACYDESSGRIVVAYAEKFSPFHGEAVVGEVSGTTIAFGTPVTFNAATTGDLSIAADPTAGKVVVAYNNASGSGDARVGTVSGATISFGTAATFNAANTEYPSVTYDPLQDKTLIVYKDTPETDELRGVVGTVSGANISFGSESVLMTGATSRIRSVYDATAERHLITCQDSSPDSVALAAIVSGASVSAGASQIYATSSNSAAGVTYSPTAGKDLIVYVDADNSNFGTAISVSISGTVLSFGSPVVFRSGNVIDAYLSCCYGGDLSFIANGINTADSGEALTYNLGGSSNVDWIGIAREAIADGEVGAVATLAGTAPGTGLTPKSIYYADDTGGLTTTDNGVKIGKALSTTELLITEGNA